MICRIYLPTRCAYLLMNPVSFYKCLADETRLKSLLLIQQEGELCVCELMAALDESQPKVSRHLAQLRQCELLLDRKEGQWVYYKLNPALEAWAIEVISTTANNNKEFMENSYKQLNAMGDRPVSKAQCC